MKSNLQNVSSDATSEYHIPNTLTYPAIFANRYRDKALEISFKGIDVRIRKTDTPKTRVCVKVFSSDLVFDSQHEVFDSYDPSIRKDLLEYFGSLPNLVRIKEEEELKAEESRKIEYILETRTKLSEGVKSLYDFNNEIGMKVFNRNFYQHSNFTILLSSIYFDHIDTLLKATIGKENTPDYWHRLKPDHFKIYSDFVRIHGNNQDIIEALKGDEANFIELYNDSDGFKPLLVRQTKPFEDYLGYEIQVNTAKSAVAKIISGDPLAKYKTFIPKKSFGMILFGPPGTGKTFFMKELSIHAENLVKKRNGKIKILDLKLTDYASSYHNKGEQNLQKILSDLIAFRNKDEGNFIFIMMDEAETIVGERGGGDGFCNKSNDAIVNILLQHLGSQEHMEQTILVCATNHLDRIDKAFRRPGRLDQTIKIDYLNDEKSIFNLFKLYLNKYSIYNLLNDEQISKIKRISYLMIGRTVPATIKSIVDEVVRRIEQLLDFSDLNYLNELELETAKSEYQKVFASKYSSSMLLEACSMVYVDLEIVTLTQNNSSNIFELSST